MTAHLLLQIKNVHYHTYYFEGSSNSLFSFKKYSNCNYQSKQNKMSCRVCARLDLSFGLFVLRPRPLLAQTCRMALYKKEKEKEKTIPEPI
jgi:hypothetical protein